MMKVFRIIKVLHILTFQSRCIGKFASDNRIMKTNGYQSPILSTLLIVSHYICGMSSLYLASLNVSKALATVSTIMKCGEAAALDMFFHDRLKAVVLNENHKEEKKSPPLLVGEKQLLNLAVYEECSDAIFYVMPVIIEVNGENNLFLRLEYVFQFRFVSIKLLLELKHPFIVNKGFKTLYKFIDNHPALIKTELVRHLKTLKILYFLYLF